MGCQGGVGRVFLPRNGGWQQGPGLEAWQPRPFLVRPSLCVWALLLRLFFFFYPGFNSGLRLWTCSLGQGRVFSCLSKQVIMVCWQAWTLTTRGEHHVHIVIYVNDALRAVQCTAWTAVRSGPAVYLLRNQGPGDAPASPFTIRPLWVHWAHSDNSG